MTSKGEGSRPHAFGDRFIADESAAPAVEYGLIAALICLVVFAATSAVFHSVGNTFNLVSNKLQTSAS